MNGNPFYVDPGFNLLPGLKMFGQGMAVRREKQAIMEAEEKKRKASEAAIEAYKTNDPDIIATTILANPEIGETLSSLYEKRRDYKREDYVTDLENMLTELETTGTISSPPEETEGLGFTEEDLPPDTLPGAAPAPMAPTSGLTGLAGGTPTPVTAPGKGPINKTDIVKSIYKKNPAIGKKMIEYEFAKNDPKRYKVWKEVYRDGGSKTGSNLKKLIDERQKLLDEGLSEDDPKVKAYNAKIWPEENQGAPSNLKKMIEERATYLQNGADPTSDIIRGYNNRILGEAADKVYSPSPLKKLIQERQDYIKSGMKPTDPIIKAYDNKISGIDIDIEDLTQEEIDMWGAWVNAVGKMPSVGRGKQATKIRAAILKSAARQALGDTIGDKKRTPIDAAMEVVGKQADTKSIQMALGQLEKQTAAMGSFITNMEAQIERVKEIAAILDQDGIRIMNVPRRLWRSRIIGHPNQAKYDLYLAEIETEIGKLAQGNAQSIAELSTHAQQRWDKIHDKNLSTSAMLELLSETSHAGRMRIRSVEDQLERTREKMRTRKYTKTPIEEGEKPVVGSREEYEALPSGTVYKNKHTGKLMRKP